MSTDNNPQIIAKFIHGSHLYKLDTPESDKDFVGIYMPSEKSLLTCNVEHSYNFSSNKENTKNSAEDTDFTVYSIHHFVKLLSKGEMVAFDMLYAPESAVEYYDQHGNRITSELAEQIHHPVYLIRHSYLDVFVHSDMRSYLGYCRRQAAKYGIRGSRLDSLYEIIKIIEPLDGSGQLKLECIRDRLPENEFVKKTEDFYEVLGKKHSWGTFISEFHQRIRRDASKYGSRAHQAMENKGVEWKSVSHIFRAGEQLRTMLVNGHMDVVLAPHIREYIMDVKLGKLDWPTEVKPKVEALMSEIDEISKKLHPIQKRVDPERVSQVLFELVYDWHSHNKEFKE
jgi:hypothetical protein